MDKKVKLLFIAYSELDDKQQKELREEIDKYEKKWLYEQRNYSEELKKSLGPTSSITCPYCGK